MKHLERLAKIFFAMVMAVLLWRPRRPLPAKKPLKVLVVRIDNRVGEALLTTPLFDALHAAGHEVHLLAHPKMRRVLEGHPSLARIWAWRRSLTVLRELRAQRFDAVINCGNWAEPAVTSAVVARLCAARGPAIGPANLPSRWLMDQPVTPLAGTSSEFTQRAHLGAPLVELPAEPRLSFRATAPFSVVAGRYAVVNPGGRLDYRRVKPETFVDAANALVRLGVEPVVRHPLLAGVEVQRGLHVPDVDRPAVGPVPGHRVVDGPEHLAGRR